MSPAGPGVPGDGERRHVEPVKPEAAGAEDLGPSPHHQWTDEPQGPEAQERADDDAEDRPGPSELPEDAPLDSRASSRAAAAAG